MNSPAKFVIGAVLGIIAAYIVLHVVLGIISSLVHFVFVVALPILVVVGIGYGLYRVFTPRSLSGGRRILP
ncbi:MAG: hypothetical protein ACYC96_10410 [Fimbriimonadaceae bacterium]